jgi:hypothetical protein
MSLIEVRQVTVGGELRPLCTDDPKKHTPLPADSEAWDQGVGKFNVDMNNTDFFRQ